MTQVAFEVCPNCGLHGHTVINGHQLPEVHCKEHARMEVIVLKTHHLITESQEWLLLRAIALSTLPDTWADLMKAMVTSVISELAAPYVADRLSRASAG